MKMFGNFRAAPGYKPATLPRPGRVSPDKPGELEKEKWDLRGTFYHDFVKGVHKNSIYKSIQLHHVKNGTAYYECEPYDDTYNTSEDRFYETCEKLERAFKKYYKSVFAKYNVDNISVEIYDEYSCAAGLSVDETGTIIRSNF